MDNLNQQQSSVGSTAELEKHKQSHPQISINRVIVLTFLVVFGIAIIGGIFLFVTMGTNQPPEYLTKLISPTISQPSPTPKTNTNIKNLIITEKDNGKSFIIDKTTNTYLRLSTQFIWSTPKSSNKSIQIIPVAYQRDPGFSEWVIQPIEAGSTTIRSSGTPNCPTSKKCPGESINFNLTIVTIAISETQNGDTVTVQKGSTVTIVLHSTYWKFQPISDAKILQPSSNPVYTPDNSVKTPGTGTGTITQTFTALSPGTATFSASRTSCGEALTCSGNQAFFKTTIIVN